MSSDYCDPASIDATCINLGEPWEIDYWVQTFGVGEQSLRRAVDEVGRSPGDVRRYLARQASVDPAASRH